MTTKRGRRPGKQHRFGPAEPVARSHPRLDEWEDWLRVGGQAETTITQRLRTVDRFAKEVGVSPVSACHADIIEWFKSHADWAPNTGAIYHECLNRWFVWLQRMGYRDDNPMALLAKRRRDAGEPRPVSDADLVRMLAVRMHYKTRVMILLGAFAGLRVHEIAKVKGEDIDAGRGVIWVTGKGRKTKSIPLHRALLAAAENLPARGWWFPGEYEREGSHVSSTAVSQIIRGVMRRAGVAGTPHSLRHWYGTALLGGGADLRTVQECLRHADLRTTQIYTAVADDRRHEAIAGLDPWAGSRAALVGRRDFGTAV